MHDELAQIAGENALGIMLRPMRLAAEPVRAEVGHDYPESFRRDARCMAELDPVHVGVGEEPMEQNHRPAAAGLMKGELDPVRRGPEMHDDVAHPGKLPVASTHLSTSTG